MGVQFYKKRRKLEYLSFLLKRRKLNIVFKSREESRISQFVKES